MEDPPQGLKIPPKVLYFDIERAPGEAYYYDRKTEYIPTNFLKVEPFIICWSSAWVGDKIKIESQCVTTAEAKRRDDKRILQRLWELMDEADYIVGHNVDGFDLRKVGNRFLQLGMSAPLRHKTIDTLKLARKFVPFESNGLEYISVRLGNKPKRDITFADWRRIVETGDAETLRTAARYCNGDVREGIKIYKRLRDYVEAGTGKMLAR